MSTSLWPNHITIISDDETDNALFSCMLEDQFTLTFLHGSEEIESHFQGTASDLCILNEGATPEYALQILKKFQSLPNTQKPYLILFGNYTLKTKINAYELGVNEFLDKPFDIFDFNIRLSNLLESRENIRLAQTQSDKASHTALLAMETSSELGVIMRYTDMINAIHDLHELGQALLNTCRALGIKCSVQFRAVDEPLTQGNPLGSFDEQLLNEFKARGSLLDFGSRSIFNKPLVSILVKNMPINDSLKYGRLKEHFQVIINATENKVALINEHQQLKKEQSSSTLIIIQNSHSALENVAMEFSKLVNSIDHTLSWLKMELEQKLIALNLSEEQEQALMDMVEDTMERLSVAYNTGVEIDTQVNRVKSFLSSLI